MSSSLDLPFDDVEPTESPLEARDRVGRARAVDPRFNVALEASAGTGKTRVLVDRYVNLLKAGVDPSHVLAITFTRKAAAEMRERIVTTLRGAAERGEITPTRWRELRDRTTDVSVSTIDAFCLSLLREFPLEADLDPGFSLADEIEVPRLIDESLDRALRVCRDLARTDEQVALVFAQLGDRRARRGLAALLNRRLVAPDVLGRYLARGPQGLDVTTVVERAARDLVGVFERMRGGLDGFVATGPVHPGFHVLARGLDDLRSAIDAGRALDPSAVQAACVRTREYFLTKDGQPRRRQLFYSKAMFANDAVWRVHRAVVFEHGPDVVRFSRAFTRDLNVLVARGVWRMYRIAESEYRRTLDAHAVLDFPDVLLKAIELLRQMEEFAQSRFRLESRYHHVLVDEFQDTSRAQWDLMALLVQAWGAGVGAAYEGPLPPSIFIVGDRKQSIYGFRDADVSLLQEAARHLEALRPDGDVRRSISRSFRSVPALLAFVNDVCHDVEKVGERRDAFLYEEQDRFPVDWKTASGESPLGIVTGGTIDAAAAATAAEIARLLATGAVVRDRETGVRRRVAPADIAILFRTRESHREFEEALERHGIGAHVYKGLGFFDADEIKDVRALLWYLADPVSDLRAAAFLRSRFIRVTDEALRVLAPRLAVVLRDGATPEQRARLHADDVHALDRAVVSCAAWRALVDRVPPAELVDRVLRESAYAVELRGARVEQARENLKKVRALIRRLQNRGYATLPRVAAHLDHLATGDEANAPLDAQNAVSLMTVHASKGLEFPVVFVVNITRGTAGWRDPIRVFADPAADAVSVSVGDFLSEADEDARAREREETKRLLYVALTRARDRLYLGAALKDGRLQVGRGSLAEVMPASILTLFASGEVTTDRTARWVGSSGEEHVFTRVDDIATPTLPLARQPAPLRDERSVDREPLPVSAMTRRAARGVSKTSHDPGGDRLASDRVRGLAVHRLLQRRGFERWSSPAEWSSAVSGVLGREELSEVEDLQGFVEEVASTYQQVCERGDVRSLYTQGECFHEVPFSLLEEGVVVRGTIDCLVRVDEQRLVVLEFKTGRPRPEHQTQMALYCLAASRLFPLCNIEPRLIYASDAQTGGFPPENP